MTIDPRKPGYNVVQLLQDITTSREIDPDANIGFVLNPAVLVLAWTQEKIHLRDHARVAARVEGKSSLARIGLGIHVTAPTIHAGFRGPIQLEMINHGPVPIRLTVGMPVCQLVFEQTLGMPDKAYQGQFLGQEPV
jgi:dCTP deaminase